MPTPEERLAAVVRAEAAGRRQKFLCDRVLVEASPLDRVWGIGLAEGDEAAASPSR